MPYIQRDANGDIIAIYRDLTNPELEFIAEGAAELVEFIGRQSEPESPLQALADSDSDIARVTEDLIHLLVAKNLILFTELPQAVQQKLLAREKIRSSLQGRIEDFLDDSESI